METKAERLLNKIKDNINRPCELRISARGVPHLVILSGKNTYFSVCYFGNHKSFRIFYPYAVPSVQQVKIDRKLWTEVVNYFNKDDK